MIIPLYIRLVNYFNTLVSLSLFFSYTSHILPWVPLYCIASGLLFHFFFVLVSPFYLLHHPCREFDQVEPIIGCNDGTYGGIKSFRMEMLSSERNITSIFKPMITIIERSSLKCINSLIFFFICQINVLPIV